MRLEKQSDSVSDSMSDQYEKFNPNDVNEIMSNNARLEELSDSDNSMSDQYEESDPAGSGYSEHVMNDFRCQICGYCGFECHCIKSGMFWQTGSNFINQHEQLLLEGDAQVWQI